MGQIPSITFSKVGNVFVFKRIIDNMPITWCYEVADEEKRYCSASFPIGCFVTDQSLPLDACVISVSAAKCFVLALSSN